MKLVLYHIFSSSLAGDIVRDVRLYKISCLL